MSGVRVLVGTRKGAFVLTSDGKRDEWDVSGPHFGGWEIYHVKGSPADPNRIYASQSTGWFGQLIQRSDDGGTTWEPVGNEFRYDGVPGTHQWYDGTPHPWEFARVWHLEPSLTDPDTVLAGVEDAALFRLDRRRPELARARRPARPRLRAVVAAGRGRDVPAHDHGRSERSASGSSWRSRRRACSARTTAARRGNPINRGLRSEGIPDDDAEVGHCVHRLAMHRRGPSVLYMQKHWDVMRSDDAGESWQEVSGDLPTDFGFAIDVHAHEPETVYVVPIKSDSEHYPPDGRLRVYRSRTGGNEWEPLTNGLPQERLLRQRPPRRDGGRLARLLRRVLRHDRRAGLRLGRRRRQLGADRPRPARRAVGRGADAAVIRVVLPAHLRTLAGVGREVQLDVVGEPTQTVGDRRARGPLPAAVRDGPRPGDATAAAVRAILRLRGRPLARAPRTPRFPRRSRRGAEPFFVVGAMAGG